MKKNHLIEVLVIFLLLLLATLQNERYNNKYFYTHKILSILIKKRQAIVQFPKG